MDEREENLLVLRLTAEHLLTTQEWPTLGHLHRRIHRELNADVEDVGVVARRLDRHPFISGYHDLGDTFAPRLEVLGRVPESDVLLDAVLSVIKFAYSKYMSSADAEEVTVTEREVIEELGLVPSLASLVRKLLDGIPWVTAGGGAGEDGWHFRVSDLITRWSGVESRQDLLDSLSAIAEHGQREYAAMAAAKAEMVRATQPTHIVSVEPSTVSWYETPLAKGIAWTVALVVGVLTTVVLTQQL